MSVNFKENPVDLKGNVPEVGAKAPKISLKTKDLSPAEIAKKDKVQIALTAPSLDTPVCASEAKEFNQKTAAFEGAEVIVVSMDLPFAMGRFCSTENIDNSVVVSDFVAKEFGEKCGVLIANGALEGLLARVISVIKNGKIAYKELAKGIAEMSNLEAVEEFFKDSGSCCDGCGCH